MKRRSSRSILAVVLALTALVVTRTDAGGQDGPAAERQFRRPMIFVHGFAGSGAQFESQALRFTSNGYPADYINLHEYDSLFGVETKEQVFARLDDRIAEIQSSAGVKKVDLLGHSLGTTLMQEYLNSSPERAARVAHYVNLDGASSDALPGGVPTLAVWGQGDPARTVAGAANLYFTSQTHTEVVTSPETFEEIYTFFTGKEPETTEIVEEESAIQLAGRTVNFPANAGVEGSTLLIYEVNGATGYRVDRKPKASYPIGADGNWGPFDAIKGRNYEFVIQREGLALHHIFVEPFVRSDHWIRLLTSPPGGIGDQVDVGENHVSLTIIRYKEWWGDQGANNDLLQVNGVNILTEAHAPLDKRAIGIFVFDDGGDGVSDLATPIERFHGLPFFTGVDLVIPAAPPGATVSVASTTRRTNGRVQLINLPNRASLDHRFSVQFNDYVQGD